MATKATGQQHKSEVDKGTSIEDYFFFIEVDPATGNKIMKPRKDVVRRDELWYVLEWFLRKIVRMNQWWRVLGRWVRGHRMPRWNPFSMLRLKGAIKTPEMVEAGAPSGAEAGTPVTPIRKRIDANGNVVDE